MAAATSRHPVRESVASAPAMAEPTAKLVIFKLAAVVKIWARYCSWASRCHTANSAVGCGPSPRPVMAAASTSRTTLPDTAASSVPTAITKVLAQTIASGLRGFLSSAALASSAAAANAASKSAPRPAPQRLRPD